MCGFAGYAGRFPPALLEAMNHRIAHRGPDDAGTWHDQAAGIGLAHRRLSIIDLSPLGRQPMWDVTGRLVIVYNGEIYNYRELAAELEKDGFEFRSRSDTEVVLNLYLKHGPDMLSRLNGIFAFALWDTRDRSLLLARDPLGIKPLYWAETSTGLLFASELKALLAWDGLPRELDFEALDQYLTFLWCPAPRTMLRSVRKLEPGQAMMVKDGRITRTWLYYELPYDQPVASMSEGEAVEAVRAAVRTAVRRQMVADVPVGAFLSGGLDSTSVTAFAREAAGGPIPCFTMDFVGGGVEEEGFANDLPYARSAAKALDVDLREVRAGSEMIGRLEQALWHLDEPQADPAPINALLISELARKSGIKVLLSGAGGDDLFTGYRRHEALMKEAYWTWLPRPIRTGLRYAAGRLPAGRPWARRLGRLFAAADQDSDTRLIRYFHWIDEDIRLGLLSPEVRSSFNGQRPSPLAQSLDRIPENTHPLNRMLFLEAKHFLADHNLNYTDKMGMAAGVEVRVPLLDLDLVALAARLPVHYKQHGRTGKWVFKKAMEGILPNEVIYRSKTGFLAPIRPWLKNELKPLVADALSPETLKRRGLFDPLSVRRLLDLDRAGRVDGAYTIFSLLSIELWCRLFLDGRGAGAWKVIPS